MSPCTPVRRPWRPVWAVSLALVAVCLALPTRISAQPAPDLVVGGVSLTPSVARAGDVVTALVTVWNVGGTPAEPSTVGLHFAASDKASAESATGLGVLSVSPLAPGASVQLPLNFTVPPVAPGNFYVIAQADVTGAVAETSDTNNRRTAFFRVAVPDLVVDGLSVDRSTARVGDTVSVRVRVRNQGRVVAEASEGAIYFVTTVGSALAGATPMLTFPVTRLLSGASVETVLPLTVPGVAPGAFAVVARADSTGILTEGSESNNVRSVRLRVATADLVITGFAGTPATVSVGATIRGVVSLENRGPVPSYPTSATLYLATTPNADLATATHVGTVPVQAIPSSRKATLNLPVVVPLLSAGAHYLIVEVDGATAQEPRSTALAEGPAPILAGASVSTSTTTSVSKRPRRATKFQVVYPDLVVTALSVSPTKARPGETVTVSITVWNQGQIGAGPTTAGFLLGADAGAPTQELTLLGTVPVGPLRKGSSSTIQTSLLVPDITAGGYNFIAQADFAAEALESNEANNQRSMSLVIESPDTDAIDTQPHWAANPYGILVCGIDHTTPRSEIATLMQKAKEAGTGWIRTDFWWYSVEWFRGQWNWEYFDIVVEEAAARGLKVIPILQGTPAWATTDGVFSYGVPDMAAWETFVIKTVERYRGRISAWEIWNEPDTRWYWKGTPAQYAALLARAYEAIKAVDPAAQVWLGGLAQGGDFVVDNFLQQILALGAGAHFDTHNIHTNFRTMAQITQQISSNRAALAAAGFTKPLVVTEASYTSDPEYQWLPGYQGGDEGQARYLVDAYRTMLGAGVEVAVWANMEDYEGGSEYGGSGLVRIDLSMKPSFLAFQELAETTQ